MAVLKNKDGRTYYIKGKVKLPNGKWKDYQQTRIKYNRKKDAEDQERKIRLSIISNANTNDLKFNELASLFKERWSLQNIDETTIVSYDNYYQNHLKEYFGESYLKDINSRMIEDWKAWMTKRKKADGKKYAERTINNAKMILSRYLNFAISLGYIENNPCRNVKKYQDPYVDTNPFKFNENFWEIEEYKKFIEIVDDPFWHDVFEFLYKTGVREGEMFALTWNNVFFDKKIIRIQSNISPKCLEKRNGYRVKAPKNKRSYREIDMQTSLCNMLKNRFNKEKKKDGFKMSYYVFGDIKPLAQSTLARNLDRYIDIACVPRITPHGFRHSHASLLIHNKIDDSLIAERLGHTVIQLRQTYAHVYDKDRGDMKKKLDKII